MTTARPANETAKEKNTEEVRAFHQAHFAKLQQNLKHHLKLQNRLIAACQILDIQLVDFENDENDKQKIINDAKRKRLLKWHPDKNNDPNKQINICQNYKKSGALTTHTRGGLFALCSTNSEDIMDEKIKTIQKSSQTSSAKHASSEQDHSFDSGWISYRNQLR